MGVLFGRAEHTMDVKNRIRIPAKFRTELMGDDSSRKLYFVQFSDDCIALVDEQGLSARFGSFSDIDPMDEPTLNALRFFSGMVEEYEEDSQGRVVLPKSVREHIGADKNHCELVSVGMYSYLEIWTKEKYDKVVKGQTPASVRQQLSESKSRFHKAEAEQRAETGK